jgi:hypothetical protein
MSVIPDMIKGSFSLRLWQCVIGVLVSVREEIDGKLEEAYAFSGPDNDRDYVSEIIQNFMRVCKEEDINAGSEDESELEQNVIFWLPVECVSAVCALINKYPKFFGEKFHQAWMPLALQSAAIMMFEKAKSEGLDANDLNVMGKLFNESRGS